MIKRPSTWQQENVTAQEAMAVYQFSGFLARGWAGFVNKSFPGIPLNTNVSSLGLLVGFQVSFLV
jgi:hypothetical protein